MIGILSDSHDNLFKIRKAVEIFRSRDCRLVLHAGDIVAPFAVKELAAAGCPVRAVFGNVDGEKEGLRTAIQPFGDIGPAPRVIDWEGCRIFLTHIPVRIEEEAAAEAYDLLVYGHTHKAEILRRGKSLIMNPGECGGWLYGKATAGLYDPGTREAEIVDLD
jgi:putative phosphoesterase